MKVVVVFSGGMDSTVLLNKFARDGHDVHALSVFYGQRHERELGAARRVVDWVQGSLSIPITHRVLMLPELRNILAGSSQTSMDVAVPHGHYEEESMKATVVPNRNMILISLAVAYGVSIKANAVAYGAHQGDHAIYPDCRPVFITQMQRAVAVCDYDPPELTAPFISMSKASIAKIGSIEHAPIHLSYSCYEGRRNHCGLCGTCVERREAMIEAGVSDPTVYDA